MAHRMKIALYLALSVISAASVSAQPAVSDEAKRHFDRGIEAVGMAQSPEDYKPAIVEFKQAIQLAPDWPDAYYNIGVIYEKTGEYDLAIQSLRRYLDLSPAASDAAQVQTLINRLGYRKEVAEKERLDPNNLVGLWAPDEENGGAFDRFEIRNNNGRVEGGLRVYAFTEERGLGVQPWFVPVQWDGTTLLIDHTRYHYCDKSIQRDCCPADASVSAVMIAPGTLSGTVKVAAYRHSDGMTSPETIEERVWKRVK